MEAEELEAERDRRERELRPPEIVEVRQRVVGPLEREVPGAVEVERDATRQVGDVELVGIPQAAPRQRRQDEEEERRDRGRHRERCPAPRRVGRFGRPRGRARWACFRLPHPDSESAVSGLRARPRDTTSKVRRGATPALLLQALLAGGGAVASRVRLAHRASPASSMPKPRQPRPDPRRPRRAHRPAQRRQEHAPQHAAGRADRDRQPAPANHARHRARRAHRGRHAVRLRRHAWAARAAHPARRVDERDGPRRRPGTPTSSCSWSRRPATTRLRDRPRRISRSRPSCRSCPRCSAINKVDRLKDKTQLLPLIAAFAEAHRSRRWSR